MVRLLSRTVAILTIAVLAAASVPGVDARTLPVRQPQGQVEVWLGAASLWLESLVPGTGSKLGGGGPRLQAITAEKAPAKASRRGGNRLHPVCQTGIDPFGRCN